MKRNPHTYSQPDLFTSMGDTPRFENLEDLTERQIKKLPRTAFTDDEWDELDEDVQEYIHEHNDDESKERVRALAEHIYDQVVYNRSDDAILENAEGDIDYFFEDDDRLWDDQGGFIRDWAEDEFGEDFFDDDTLKEAAIDVGLTHHHADFTVTRGGGDVSTRIDGFYLDQYGLTYAIPDASKPEDYTFEEFERAIKKAEERDDHYSNDGPTVSDQDLEAQEFWDLVHGKRDRWSRGVNRGNLYHPEITRDGDYDWAALDVSWDEDAIFDDMREALGWEPGQPREAYIETAPAERIVTTLELSDGPYNVIDLIPVELAKETKKMNHCVGKRQYGYGDKIKAGQARILSVRPVGGEAIWKRSFTLELRLSPSDNTSTVQELIDGDGISKIVQVKGQRNRVPGFDKPGYAGGGHMARATTDNFTREDEWENMEVVANFLGFEANDVPDLGPGLAAYQARRRARENPPVYIEMPMQTFDMPSGEYE